MLIFQNSHRKHSRARYTRNLASSAHSPLVLRFESSTCSQGSPKAWLYPVCTAVGGGMPKSWSLMDSQEGVGLCTPSVQQCSPCSGCVIGVGLSHSSSP